MVSNQYRTYRLLAACLLLALLAAGIATAIALPHACAIGTGSDLACARGFETREHDGDRPFRWSNSRVDIQFANPGYGAPVVVTLLLRSGRPAGSPPVPARLGLNGQSLADVAVPFTNRRYTLLLPLAPPAGDLARFQIASTTWKPGEGSNRRLGLVVFRAALSPTAGVRVPGPLHILSWLALFLAIQVFPGRRAWMSAALPFLLLPLCALTPLIAYLPWLALIVGATALVWGWTQPHDEAQPHKHHTLALVLLPLLPTLPYLLIIIGVVSDPARLPLLVLTGALATVAALLWAHHAQQHPRPIRTLITAAVLVRLVLLGGRLLSGNTWLDGDVDLFYSYGMAMRRIGLPDVEYPTGALLVWSGLTWISGDSREAFALLLPLLNAACDLAIVAALAYLGRSEWERDPNERGAWVGSAAAFYAFSPLLEPFVFAKYDALPSVLAVGGLALFAARRYPLSGVLPGLGTTIKWTPLLSLPFQGLHLLRRRDWRGVASLTVAATAAIALCSLPFALTAPQAFLLPYQLQGGRGMTGESIWFLLALLQDPSLLARVQVPWGAVRQHVVPVTLMVGGQAGVLALLGGLAWFRPPALWRTLVLAAVAPPLFLLLNRIFSPQYILPISAGLLAALAAAHPDQRTVRVVLALLALAQVCNLLVWPFFMASLWVVASGVLFGALLLVSVIVVVQAERDVAV